MELEELKGYLRVDADLTEDDQLITALYDTAKQYIENTTGKKYESGGVFDTCARLIVAHWYEHRDIAPRTGGGVVEYPHSVDALLNHIKFCTAYEPQDGQGGG